MKTRICEVCGKEFKASEMIIPKWMFYYCSEECMNKFYELEENQ